MPKAHWKGNGECYANKISIGIISNNPFLLQEFKNILLITTITSSTVHFLANNIPKMEKGKHLQNAERLLLKTDLK